MNRHPELSIRKPEAASINRIMDFNKTEVTRFSKNLESVMTKFNFEPQNIFNMDKRGFSTAHEPNNGSQRTEVCWCSHFMGKRQKCYGKRDARHSWNVMGHQELYILVQKMGGLMSKYS